MKQAIKDRRDEEKVDSKENGKEEERTKLSQQQPTLLSGC